MSLFFHQGRVNLKFTLSDAHYREIIEVLQSKEVRDPVVASMIIRLRENDMWNDQYHEETEEATSDDEYWFEYLDVSIPVLGSCDINVHPHQRYVNIADQLDESHVLWERKTD